MERNATMDQELSGPTVKQLQACSQLDRERKHILCSAMMDLHGVIRRAFEAGVDVQIDCPSEAEQAAALDFLKGMYPDAATSLMHVGLEDDSVPVRYLRIKWLHICGGEE